MGARAGWVVVGVDGSDDAVRAVRYAVQEAERLRLALRLVHVVPEAVPMAAMLPLSGADALADVGRRILTEAEVGAAEASAEHARSGSVPVETVLATGPRVPALLAHAGDAVMVVLGRRASLLAHLRTGATTGGVATRATCAVVAVPDGWPSNRWGRVVAAVDGSPAAPAVIRTGLAEADSRGCRLVVLHAWRPQAPYESLLAGHRAAETWERQVEPVVWAMVAGFRAGHPQVEVGVELHYERTVDALVAAGATADLLVVGRSGDWSLSGDALGPVPRALLRAGVCPVEVVPAPPQRPPRLPRQRAQAAHVGAI